MISTNIAKLLVTKEKESIMMMGKCSKCIYKFSFSKGCYAFPCEIPLDILNGEFDHTKPYPGQMNNIIFRPKI